MFEAITQLDEYYPSRTETRILADNAAAIAAVCGANCVLVEPGSGNCEKVRYLLDAIAPDVFVPMDISSSFLHEAAQNLGNDFPWLQVHAICADFNMHWQDMPELPSGRRIIFYPGSTIGNLEPDAACAFLVHMGEWMGPDGGAIIGVDLHKSSDRLDAAYNDNRASRLPLTAISCLMLIDSLTQNSTWRYFSITHSMTLKSVVSKCI